MLYNIENNASILYLISERYAVGDGVGARLEYCKCYLQGKYISVRFLI